MLREIELVGKVRFKDNGNGTVTDFETHLMWKQSDSFQDLSKWLNWTEANTYIKELNTRKFAGFQDWRLPDLEEAESLYDEEWSLRDLDRFEIHIPSSFSPGGGHTTWTSEIRPHAGAVIFYYRYGHANINNKEDISKDSARAVREAG